MLTLPHGCYCSQPTVHPKNWMKANASVASAWYIHYRFYDPAITDHKGAIKPKQEFIKGMNRFKTIGERREATAALLKNELDLLQNEGYNPITKARRPAGSGELSAQTFMMDALQYAGNRLDVSKKTKQLISQYLKHIETSSRSLKLNEIPINKIRRRDILAILDHCGAKRNWSANTFNSYRAHLMMVFKKLVEYESIEINPIAGVSKRKTVKRQRPCLSMEDRKKVNEHLFTYHRDFWLFMQIFFHSGGRESELLSVKAKDVDLHRQQYKVTVLKRRAATEVTKTIKDIALPFWKAQLDKCRPEDYVFSKWLEPGPVMIHPAQITKRWRKYVKQELGITADFYSLKHLNTTETVELLDEQAAAAHNAHTTTAMVINIYDINREKRQHERIKRIQNSFS